jgi:hypothetical protein
MYLAYQHSIDPRKEPIQKKGFTNNSNNRNAQVTKPLAHIWQLASLYNLRPSQAQRAQVVSNSFSAHFC